MSFLSKRTHSHIFLSQLITNMNKFLKTIHFPYTHFTYKYEFLKAFILKILFHRTKTNNNVVFTGLQSYDLTAGL